MISLVKFTPVGSEHGRYAFDPVTGSYTMTLHATFKEASERCCGFADQRRVRMMSPRELFAALYVQDGQLQVCIDSRVFVWPGRIVARRRTIAPFLKSFEIIDQGVRELRFLYWYSDHFGFPGPEATDIFLQIARRVRNPTEVSRTLYLFQAKASGRVVETDDFMKEVDAFIKKAQ